MSQLTFGEPFGDPALTAERELHEPLPATSWYKGRVLSHSSISLYQTCPQKWKFRYLDKVPELPRPYFSFGKSVHAGLEFLFSRDRTTPPSVEELVAFYKAQWISEGYESAAQEKWFFQEGDRILRGFYAKHQLDHERVVEVELKFEVDIDGVPVMGYIDRIDATAAGGLAVIDYKTGRAFDKSRVKKDPQLTLYQIAVQDRFKKPVEALTLYHLNSLTPLTVPAHSPLQEAEYKNTVVTVARGISVNNFDPTPNEAGHCQWCDYQQICPAMAAKKKRGSPAGSLQPGVRETVDRLGKLDLRLKHLHEERSQTEQALKIHFEQAQADQLTGAYFMARRRASDDGAAGFALDTAPLEKEPA